VVAKLDKHGTLSGTNAAHPSVLSRAPSQKERGPAAVLYRVERPDTLVAVDADGSLRRRIVEALEKDRMSVVLNGSTGTADIRIVAVDLSQPVSLRHLRAILGNGNGRIVAVSPGCGALGLRRALRAGADALVLEHKLEDALAPGVRAVVAGLSVVPCVLRGGAERLAFSHREREVLRLAITGHTNGEIASTLFLAESTVKSHLSSAYRKLGADGRSDAASMIFDPDEGLAEMVLGHDASGGLLREGHAA
jgi:DNA-binding NarL/FixJ family response regulator